MNEPKEEGPLFEGKPEQNVYTWMGFCLSLVQYAERMMARTLGMPLHKAPFMSSASMEAEEEAARRRTLGQLLHEVRKRADVSEHVDVLMNEFLVQRNRFVHHITQDPEYSTHEPQGRDKLLSFLKGLCSQAWRVIQVLLATQVAFFEYLEEVSNGEIPPFIEPMNPVLREILQAARELPTEYRIRRKLHLS